MHDFSSLLAFPSFYVPVDCFLTTNTELVGSPSNALPSLGRAVSLMTTAA